MSLENGGSFWDSAIGGIDDLIGLSSKVIALTKEPEPKVVYQQEATRQTLQNNLQTPATKTFDWKPWAIGSGIILGFVAVLITIIKVLRD
ncbi:MAG: hypothetical protein NE327_06330 [Lentisphaeraceae bacterium]|nr:hypothetical protein [Lentisphaeraceae bacterium]